MDGFWAFQMERRGAASSSRSTSRTEELDWPRSLRHDHERTMDETKAERFALAREALGSRWSGCCCRRTIWGPELGTFDSVFCGDPLLHLKDPFTPMGEYRSVGTGSAVMPT